MQHQMNRPPKLNPPMTQRDSEKKKEIQNRISLYLKRIQKLQLEISYCQDLISDLNSDIQMIESQKGNPSGSKEEEE